MDATVFLGRTFAMLCIYTTDLCVSVSPPSDIFSGLALISPHYLPYGFDVVDDR